MDWYCIGGLALGAFFLCLFVWMGFNDIGNNKRIIMPPAPKRQTRPTLTRIK